MGINKSPVLMSHNASWRCEVLVHRSWICYVYAKFVDNSRIYSCSHFTKELELLILLCSGARIGLVSYVKHQEP